jgi:hypothetical protein
MSATSLLNVTLSNGVLMPAVGLGTYKLKDLSAVSASLRAALNCGYRLIDTARGAIHQLLSIILKLRILVLLPVSTMSYVVIVKNYS